MNRRDLLRGMLGTAALGFFGWRAKAPEAVADGLVVPDFAPLGAVMPEWVFYDASGAFPELTRGGWQRAYIRYDPDGVVYVTPCAT